MQDGEGRRLGGYAQPQRVTRAPERMTSLPGSDWSHLCGVKEAVFDDSAAEQLRYCVAHRLGTMERVLVRTY